LNIGSQNGHVESVCVYCGSSNTTDPEYLKAAAQFGALLAAKGVRMVYGGGGVGLMGACAKAAHNAGGKVLGVMPNFLRAKEILYDEVETIVVQNMHERKRIMFEQSDAFVVLPGGIGTLEEIVEMLSWKRLALHDKPMVFYSPGGFWAPFIELMQHTVDKKLTPPAFMDSFRSVETVEEILPAVASMISPMTPQPAASTAARLT
jgi:uncharacterized protein (TIGR00730 family)